MARTHPPTLLRTCRRTLIEECAISSGDRILAAVSGGPDSTALMHALARLSRDLGFGLAACGIDHGLRSEASAELDGVESLAGRWGIAFHRITLEVAPGSNLQARARTARRDALERAAREHGFGHVATGHHADDRAETVVLRLLRGAGPKGLAVLPPRDGSRIRPLIRARRRDILDHLARHDIAFAQDPSNEDPRFLRVRVRREVLPMLEALSPTIVGHLNALADQLLDGRAPPAADQEGEPLTLGRAQAVAVRRALDRAQPAAVALSADRILEVDGRAGTVRIVQASRPRRAGRGTGRGPR